MLPPPARIRLRFPLAFDGELLGQVVRIALAGVGGRKSYKRPLGALGAVAG